MRHSTQPSEMGQIAIIWGEDEPAFRVPLSIPVIELLQSEICWSKLYPEDPFELLARSYHEWETPPGPDDDDENRMPTCFQGTCRASITLFWTLTHFSEANFPVAERQHGALASHTLEVSTWVRCAYIRRLMSTVTADSLDYCWYLLVRLMIIEYGLAARAGTNLAIQRHIGLIHLHYGYLVEDLRRFHEFGWLTTPCPGEDFERRLMDLAANEPRLKPIAARIIQDWARIQNTGRELQWLAKIMGSQLHHEMGEAEVNDAGRAEDDFDDVDSPRERERALRQMSCLERVMTSEPDGGPAWHHPLEYLETSASDCRVVFLDSAVQDFFDEELSNGQKFQLALIGRLADRGFRRWLFSTPETCLHCIHRWLKESGNSCSMKSLCDRVRRYMQSPLGRRQPSLRELLLFPAAPEPCFVSREVRYWEEVRVAKEQFAADVELFMAQHENEKSAAMQWMRPRADRKYIVVGDGRHFQDDCLFNRRAVRNKSLVVRHRVATLDYGLSAGTFNLFRGMAYAAYEVGRKKGWGIHQSAALPIKGNQPFLAVFESGELREAREHLDWQFLITQPDDYANAVVFTAEDDGNGNAPYFVPIAGDCAAPVVGAAN